MPMTYRWLEPAELDLVNEACRKHGYAQLNINPDRPTARVLGAFWDEQLIEVFCFQLYPVLGPMLKVEPTFRDDGTTARTLAKIMHDFLEEAQARGYLAIADSPMTERLCERYNMKRLESPVFEYVRSAQ